MTTQDITPELLLQGYAQGVFPMAEHRDDPDIFWVNPERRAVFPLDAFHISRSLARRIKRGGFEVAVNRDFASTVTACADREETWINDTIFDLYGQLHTLGFAHSLEVRVGGDLVGGVYGVSLGGAFFGESMFSRATDMSKVALAFLVDRLRLTGFTLFDAQFLTDHLASLGAEEILRATYLKRLERALEAPGDFAGSAAIPSGHELLQRSIQTS